MNVATYKLPSSPRPYTPFFSAPLAFEMVAIGVVANATQLTDPGQGALAVDAYLRIASMTILAYEYVPSTAFCWLSS